MVAGNPHFVLGSTSPHKVEAVRDALRLALPGGHMADFVVDAVAVQSGVAEQPMGFGEINMGATNRAQLALRMKPEAHFGIGIESGAVDISGENYDDFLDPTYIDLAVIVLLERATGKSVRTTSTGIPVPLDCIRSSQAHPSSCQKTAGQFFAERYGGDATDMCSTLTAGVMTRRMQLTQAIVAALMIMVVDPSKNGK